MTKAQLIAHQERLCDLYNNAKSSEEAEAFRQQIARAEMALLYGAYDGAKLEPKKSIEEYFNE